MTTPFNSDDMMKRSLFGAIFGFKKGSSTSRSRSSSIDTSNDQPGPSWASSSSSTVSIQSSSTNPIPSAYIHPHNSLTSSNPHPPPPLPLISSQCPFSHRSSFSSLDHPYQPPSSSHHPLSTPIYPPPIPFYTSIDQPPPPYTSYPVPIYRSDEEYEKTKADIYREIVNECEEFERSTTTTPLIDSNPTSPTIQSHQQWYDNQRLNEMTSNLSMTDTQSLQSPYQFNKLHNILQQQVDIKPLVGGSSMSLEELVKFVVQAVKETNGGNNGVNDNDQSPEEILRRKRQMNNEAAARYRKRQRKEKEKQFEELDVLEQRNQDLKKKAEDMEREISILKKYVLEQRGEVKVELN